MWAGVAVAAAPVITSHAQLAPVTAAPLLALVTVGALPVMGAALIPDVDHTNGTIAHSMGSVTKLVTKVVSVISGGHRQATHGLWFWLVTTLAAFSVHTAAVHAPARPADHSLVGSGWSWVVAHGDLLTFFVLTAFGQRALGAKWLNKAFAKVWHSMTGPAVGVLFFLEAGLATGLAALVWRTPQSWVWLPFAVSVGHLSHLIADTMTTAGVMWLWPSQKILRVPIIGDAGSVRETIWSAVVWVGYAAACVYAVAHPFVSLHGH